jgi:hypothetical protein
MKPSPRSSPAVLSEAFSHQLNSYAMAATAAGVGLFALVQPSEAEIVYTKANQVIPPNSHYALDLNHDGTTDFILENIHGSTDSAAGANAEVLFPEGNAVMAAYRTRFSYLWWACALVAGVEVEANGKFDGNKSVQMAATWYDDNGPGHRGKWLDIKGRYLGLRFTVNGERHYGWARLNTFCRVGSAGFECNSRLTGYAYETVPNKPIITGQTKGPDVPAPHTLAGLAAGRR